jgi:hypothetical protein
MALEESGEIMCFHECSSFWRSIKICLQSFQFSSSNAWKMEEIDRQMTEAKTRRSIKTGENGRKCCQHGVRS